MVSFILLLFRWSSWHLSWQDVEVQFSSSWLATCLNLQIFLNTNPQQCFKIVKSSFWSARLTVSWSLRQDGIVSKPSCRKCNLRVYVIRPPLAAESDPSVCNWNLKLSSKSKTWFSIAGLNGVEDTEPKSGGGGEGSQGKSWAAPHGGQRPGSRRRETGVPGDTWAFGRGKVGGLLAFLSLAFSPVAILSVEVGFQLGFHLRRSGAGNPDGVEGGGGGHEGEWGEMGTEISLLKEFKPMLGACH